VPPRRRCMTSGGVNSRHLRVVDRLKSEARSSSSTRRLPNATGSGLV
jgi:hypothetical protein